MVIIWTGTVSASLPLRRRWIRKVPCRQTLTALAEPAFACSWQADASPRAAAKALHCHAHPPDSADVPVYVAVLAGGILKPPDSLLPEPSSPSGLLWWTPSPCAPKTGKTLTVGEAGRGRERDGEWRTKTFVFKAREEHRILNKCERLQRRHTAIRNWAPAPSPSYTHTNGSYW